MQKLLLLGAEAIAQGAIDSGMSGIFAYPGTPSTEITEYVQHSKEAREKNIRSEWGTNEKTAMEAGIGMSYAGKRAMVCMKHVGLNVAADAFVNSAITGANGGLIIVSADDPSMHSSQNEQDSRFYGKFAFMPIFEPSNQQEAYDMTKAAFKLSEEMELPVLMRITTRLAHSRAGIERHESIVQNEISLPKDLKKFILLPAIARKNYRELLHKQIELNTLSENSTFNTYTDGKDKSLGIIACGIAHNYLYENFEDRKIPHPVLKISQYPSPDSLVRKLYDECDEILVLEEGMPLLEEMIKGFMNNGKTIHGRLDGSLPRDGELNPKLVAKGLGMEVEEMLSIPDIVAGRPPKLCPGCSHIDSYKAITESLLVHKMGRVFADIGCYTLGALEPYNAINSCVDMGASITMAKGAADAGLFPAVGVIGDSTFTHSGMTGLLDCCNDKSNVVIVIMDNSITGMTGGQTSSATGKIEEICIALGVEKEHLRIIKPVKKYHQDFLDILKEEYAYDGVSVIIPRRECVVSMNKKMRQKRLANNK